MTDMNRPAGIGGILAPGSVAVIGASEDLTKFGGRLYTLLVQHKFPGVIYPINPKRESLLGIQCYAAIGDTPTAPDLAVMAVPRDHVKAAVQECAAAGTRAAVIITAKFSDSGEEGAALEREIVEIARAAGMRLIGPNCLGIISPANKLALCSSPALFVDKLPEGRIGIVSQSGALMATIFDRAQTRGVGFSHCFSIGNQADMELCDFLEFLIDDPATGVICTYVEGLKDGPRFLEMAARARAAGKPILAVKAGRTDFGAAAAFSHTASLAGSYDAFATACRETGVVLLDDADAMIMLAASLTTFATPARSDVAILTTSGGGGAITADRLADAGLPMAAFDDGTAAAMEELFDSHLTRVNPMDMGAAKFGGSTANSNKCTQALMKDSGTGLVIAPITTSPDVAKICMGICDGMEIAAEGGARKPCLIVVQPGQAGDKARADLRARGMIYLESIDEAIRVAEGYRTMLASSPRNPASSGSPGKAPEGLSGALDEAAAKTLLAAYGVPVNRGEVVAEAGEGALTAGMMDGPLVVKVVSPDIVHKSDAGGVALNLAGPEEVSEAIASMQARLAKSHPDAKIDGFLVQEMVSGAFEMFIGATNDPQFGPMVMVGAGGVVIELLKDVAMARAPVTPAEATAMLTGLKVAPLLAGYRGAPALDVAALADAVSRVSWLAADLGEGFAELDVNPVLVRVAGQGCTGVDARILMEG
ncbi:acetate--CoA ligase family protein [Pseudooceanicola sp.]|uniref:acetate--CoA ligase family protein n=1 Tax=Pseudooceanicola sp. TaxID=1914328 RepID=UPI00260F7C1C|nr:acetate--CoA ligase family protein [Pseudooceanicola sp.]MDF1855898.1 acetate--CoA ligase family protein [Pseudooceanicola sp.]